MNTAAISSVERRGNLQFLANLMRVYDEKGYEVLLGNPDCLPTSLRREGRAVDVSYAIPLSDIMMFQWIAEMAPWTRALVIGNAFGFSTFVVAGLCPGCFVDVIDAEVEGSENGIGSALTRKIAQSEYPRVNLTIGYSPQDLAKACRFQEYEFIFIDGLHTNEQLIEDFKAVRERLCENSVVFCHDVGIARMHSGWSFIKTNLLGKGDEAYDLHFTSFGSSVVVRGNEGLKRDMRRICRPLKEHYYYFGSRHIGIKSAARMLLRTLLHSASHERRWKYFQSKP